MDAFYSSTIHNLLYWWLEKRIPEFKVAGSTLGRGSFFMHGTMSGAAAMTEPMPSVLASQRRNDIFYSTQVHGQNNF